MTESTDTNQEKPSSPEKCPWEDLSKEELDEMMEKFDFLKHYRPCCSF